jgi:two-component system CheB/CheR fusion protein
MAESEKKIPAKRNGRKSPKANNQAEKDFLVVGLGASAGGVRALQEFFATMPPNSGMAFVAILHLSPRHESDLAPILQAQTTMPVIQVNETHKVEPNHVYVIPPNHDLEMVDGVVRPIKVEKKEGRRVAVDFFFRTLAESYARNAVCIVLSGTGSDGTLGLKRVKESNGFAIVQSPEDAEYDQMPRSAIATGLVDWILPVHRMPEKLIGFRQSSERLHLTNGADAERVADEIDAQDSLREILTILRIRTGHDFSNYKKPTLVRRIARHLQIHELEDLPSYVKYLRENAGEVHSLQRNLLINVTNFFRDREAFVALETEVIPTIFADKTGRDTVRVWTAGCASGEEAFSIATLLTEYAEKLDDPPKIMVFATDIDDEAIAQAREHAYPETIENDVSPERLKRFFIKDGTRYRIRKELREAVLFAPHNILRDPPFSKLDLISCRNLLIYFNREAQKRVMDIFHFALKPDGFLFLGTSESAESVPELFESTNKKMRLYRRRSAHHGLQSPPRIPVSGMWQISAPVAEKLAERVKTPSLGEVHYKLLENLAPPSVLINNNFEIVYMSQSVGRYLHFAGGEPTKNLLKLVNPDLLVDLRAALFSAQRDNLPVEMSGVRADLEGQETRVNVNVRSVGDADASDENFLLVIFDEEGATRALPKAAAKRSVRKTTRAAENDGAMATIINRLEDELQRARLNLRTTIEQHEVSIEELKASNEELQAINEELRSATE